MNTSSQTSNVKEFNTADAVFKAQDYLQRDQEQSHRLHEPESITSHTDPITGNDVMGDSGHPSIKDGILNIQFESERTRSEYLNTHINHPVEHLPFSPGDLDDRGG